MDATLLFFMAGKANVVLLFMQHFITWLMRIMAGDTGQLSFFMVAGWPMLNVIIAMAS